MEQTSIKVLDLLSKYGFLTVNQFEKLNIGVRKKHLYSVLAKLRSKPLNMV